MTADEEPNFPHPPRYRWLLRLAIAYAIFTGLLVGLWFAWNAYSWHAYNAEIARLQAAGQRVTVDDFNARPAVPDNQNAATFYIAAAAGLSSNSYTPAEAEIDDHVDWTIPLDDAQRQALRSFPVTFARQLAIAHQARSFSHASWPVKFSHPMINFMLPSLNNMRSLANIMGYTARGEHADGRDDQAIEMIRNILHEGATENEDVTSLVQHLVAIGIDSLAAGATRDMAGELKIGGPGGASSDQLRALIADLLADRNTGAFTDAMCTERAFELDTARTTPTALGASIPTAYMPAIRLTAVRMAASMTNKMARFDPAHFLASKAAFAEPTDWSKSILTNVADVFARLVSPTFSRLIVTEFRHTTDCRAAAVLLAIRWYQVDHAGLFPTTLDALVPTYLPAVPGDPFSSPTQPMGYLQSVTLDGVMSPAVYSVAENSKDDHASTKPTVTYSRSVQMRENPYDREDLVYPLRSLIAATPATSQSTTLPSGDQN